MGPGIKSRDDAEILARLSFIVMAGPDPAIHVLTAFDLAKTWIRGLL